MLIPASQPHPHMNKPAATIYMLTLTATITVPTAHMPHETNIELRKPKLTKKKDIAM